MIFWVVASAACIVVALAVWLAVLRTGAMRPTAAYDLDLYRDQLKELDRDIARGVIGEAEAERARLEISRRILEADKALQAAGTAGSGQVLPVAILLLLTVGGAIGLYAVIGAPGYPDLPLGPRIAAIEAERAARAGQEEAEASAPAFPAVELSGEDAAAHEALQARVDADPDDTQAWFDLAVAEAQARNYVAARMAQERGIALLGPRAEPRVHVDHARMLILAAGGYVSPEAEAALETALALDPRNGEARFLLGAMYRRQNRPDLAFVIWRSLLADSTPDAPWVTPIIQQIEEVAFFAGQRIDLSPQAPASGPTQDQIDAAAEMSPEDRLAMVENMVQGLNDRLAAEGGPAEDWARLIGAYAVLGRVEAAQAILGEAREVFAGDAAAQALFDQAAANLPEAVE